MFIAGECASVLLHRDLTDAGIQRSVQMGRRGERFAGWPVLGDIEGLRGDEAANATIATRFLVARLIRALVDDDLVVDPKGLRHQLDGVRRELESHNEGGSEREMWERVLVAVEEEDHRELLSAVLEWGGKVEAMGHLSGAHELHEMSYQLAVAQGVVGVAVDAARFLGRVSRKLTRWDDAVHWYGVARRVAEEVGSRRKLALVLDGMGNAYRDRGNLPRAREILGEVLALGREEEDLHAQAIAHHDLMTVEKLAGELDTAIYHGWEAAKCYEAREGTLKAFFDLAGVLKERGELSAAWDAYAVVAAQVESYDYRVLSVDGMAHIAALRGEEARYEELRARVDGLEWGGASPVVQAQILLYRGLSLQALERFEEAQGWLARALSSAEKHGLSQLIFEAEKAQGQKLPPSGQTRPAPWKILPDLDPSAEILEVRRGLQEMRAEAVGAAGAL
jgi:tetratricopeptide (TPR) repeat protein